MCAGFATSKEKIYRVMKNKCGRKWTLKFAFYTVGFWFIFVVARRGLPRQVKRASVRSPHEHIIDNDFVKVAIVFGTRPEAVKMAPVIQALSASASLTAVTISTGQHKEMLEQVLRQFNLQSKIDYELSLMQPNQELSQLTSRAVLAIDEVLQRVKPAIVLVQGDTTTAFITSLAAFYLQIPVGHIEAGLRTHNIYSPFPEEVNRQCISVIATYHFAPTNFAAQNLQQPEH